MTSLEEGLVAILKSEIKGTDLGSTDPEAVVLRPLRIFHTNNRGQREGQV